MLKFFGNSDYFSNFVDGYHATVYVKGMHETVKKNFLYPFAPSYLYMDRDMFAEALLSVHYRAPSYHSGKVTVVSNSFANVSDIEDRVMQFLQVNIYRPDVINDEVRLPERDGAFRYYRFEYLGKLDTLGYSVHRIGVHPKTRSEQLVSGTYYIIDGIWNLIRVEMRGRREFSKFLSVMNYAPSGGSFPLLSTVDLSFETSIAGNITANRYHASFTYESILSSEPQWEKKPTYDLSRYFGKAPDSLAVVDDDRFWAYVRPVPLTAEETAAVELYDSQSVKHKRGILYTFNNISKGIFAPVRFRHRGTQMSYSGLANPLEISFMKTEGLGYRQQFSLSKQFNGGREISFTPAVSMFFKKRQLYFRTPLRWLFNPRRFGEILFSIENRNQTYGFKTIEMVNEALRNDSIDFDDLNLDYYNHLRMNAEAKYEVANGLNLHAGVNMSKYIPVIKHNPDSTQLPSNSDDDLKDIARSGYRDLSFILGMDFTPGSYYRIDGKKKKYIGSRFPTLTVEYAKGTRLIMSNSDFSRIEADLQQNIKVRLMSSVQYFIGAGMFLSTGSAYFTNFNRFRKNNFPQSWSDPDGGVFQLLDGQWYDASLKYLQAHIMYEYPYTILRPFRGITKDIVKERVYVSYLHTPSIRNYYELGYGVGNFLGNIAIFVSFRNYDYQSLVVKISFGLDDKK
jgi:hypothetical protein